MTDKAEEIELKNLDTSMLTHVAGDLVKIDVNNAPSDLAELATLSRKYLKLLLDKGIEDLANND